MTSARTTPRAASRRALPRTAVLASVLTFSLAAWAVIAVAWWPV